MDGCTFYPCGPTPMYHFVDGELAKLVVGKVFRPGTGLLRKSGMHLGYIHPLRNLPHGGHHAAASRTAGRTSTARKDLTAVCKVPDGSHLLIVSKRLTPKSLRICAEKPCAVSVGSFSTSIKAEALCGEKEDRYKRNTGGASFVFTMKYVKNRL